MNNIGDERKLKELKELYMTSKLLKDETYWRRLQNLTVSDALTQITAIQNRIHLDLIPYLNYNYSLVGHNSMIFDMYKVAAFPKKVALLEGETVKVDFYLSHYATNPGSNVTFWINNRQLLVNAGVAHFEKPETIVGKKIIKVTARILNPLTGQITTADGEFEYEVLPKCAKNCQ